jgi:hypothetical protein
MFLLYNRSNYIHWTFRYYVVLSGTSLPPPQKFAAVAKFELIYGTVNKTDNVEQLPRAWWFIRRSTWLHKFIVGGTGRHCARKSHWPINTWSSHSQCLSESLKRGTPTNMTHRHGYRFSTSHVPLQTDAHNLSLVTTTAVLSETEC